MEEIKKYIKKHKIPYTYLCHETGYSPVHMSVLINGKSRPTEKFLKLLIAALTKYAKRDIKELRATLEKTPWKSYMSR